MLKNMFARLHRLVMNPDGRQAIPKQHIRRFLPDRPVIVEAGAHNGFDTVSFEHYMPGCTVHAFEPIPEQLALARRRADERGSRGIHFYPLAIGQEAGRATIHVSSGASTASSSLLPPKEHLVTSPQVRFERTLEVQVVRLDDWAAEHKVGRVDFLWLDLQGYELAAMRGGEEMIRQVSAIHTEVNLVEVYQGVPLYHQVRQWLLDRGMRVDRVDFPDETQGNVLFVRR